MEGTHEEYCASTEPDVISTNASVLEPRATATDKPAQEARICRVPPWEWREVKKRRTIDPKLPALLASSKGHGRVGRRSNTQKSTKSDNGVLDEEELTFDIAYRVAINSRILLNVLGACTGMDFPEDSNVWLRPFKYLVAYESEIKRALRDAEFKVDQLKVESRSSDPAVSIQTNSEVSTKPVHGRGEVDADNAIDVSNLITERDQLRCLVDFMDSDMQDIFEVKRQVANQSLKEVAFEHLWLLYAPGDLVYTNETQEETSTYQAYRVLHVTGGRPILDTLNSCRFNSINDRDWEDESDTEEKARDTIRGSSSITTPLIIDCFSIDFDGNRIGPKSRRFVVPTFTGKRKVDVLEVYPSFSLSQHEKRRKELIERGRKFTQLANGTHKKYSGLTLRETRELLEAGFSYWNYTIHAEEVLKSFTTHCPFLISIIAC